MSRAPDEPKPSRKADRLEIAGLDIAALPPDRPVLIAGATASGKSGLALEIARRGGGRIVNADALQVYAGWRVLTARPSAEDVAEAPHLLYGHVPWGAAYSVGHWLREIAPILADGGPRPIIVGGTGLYFRALTEGLAEIPPVPAEISAEAESLDRETMLAELDARDPVLAGRIDRQNLARVRRGWEVLRATGRPLSDWQADTPPPLLPLADCVALHLDADRDWLAARIESRFGRMLEGGALEEARENLARWDRADGEARAIGAPELIAHLRGAMTLDEAREAAVTATRRYAKRQRTWFRARMGDWTRIPLP